MTNFTYEEASCLVDSLRLKWHRNDEGDVKLGFAWWETITKDGMRQIVDSMEKTDEDWGVNWSSLKTKIESLTDSDATALMGSLQIAHEKMFGMDNDHFVRERLEIPVGVLQDAGLLRGHHA